MTQSSDLLIRKVSVLDLNLLEVAVVVADSVAMLILPFLSNLFLLDHHSIGALFVTLIPFFSFQ